MERERGLARPAGTTQQIAVRDPPAGDGPLEGIRNVGLYRHGREVPGAVFAGEDLIGGGVGHVHFQRQSGLRRG